MLRNPIVQREFTSALRSKTALAAICCMALLFAALVIIRWPSDAMVRVSENTGVSIESTQLDVARSDLESGTQSQEVFRMVAYGLLTSILLLAPVFPATSIVRERASGTLALLLNSPMNALSIYLGKVVAFLAFVLLLLTVSLPASAACFAMGGISLTEDILKLYLLLIVTALQGTTIALLVSSYANSTDSALRITYGALLAVVVIALGPHFFLQGKGTLTAQVAEWLRCLSPIPATMELLAQDAAGARGIANSQPVIDRFFLLSLIGCGVCAVWTILRLNHHMLDRSRSQGVITNERSNAAQWLRRIVFLVDPQRRTGGIGPFTNPVMVKEFRCRRFGRFHWMLRLAAISAVVSLGLTFASTLGATDWGPETIGGIMVLLQAALIVLITPSLSAGLISTEVESGGWDLLQMTPMSGFKILRGKLFSVIWPVLLVLVSTIPGYLVMVWIKPEMWLTIRQVLYCLGLTALLSIAISVAASSLFRRTAMATTVAYSGLAIICAGTMLVWLLRDAPFGHATVESALMINPIATALHVMKTPGFTEYALAPLGYRVVGGISAFCFVVMFVQTGRLLRPR